jgi:hypothetical protein
VLTGDLLSLLIAAVLFAALFLFLKGLEALR